MPSADEFPVLFGRHRFYGGVSASYVSRRQLLQRGGLSAAFKWETGMEADFGHDSCFSLPYLGESAF